jgi:Protein of unknown function (DUF3558)
MPASPVVSTLMVTGALLAAATGCAHAPAAPQTPPPAAGGGGFRSGDCNLVSDDEVKKATRSGAFTKVVSGDAGCFWQEDTMLGSFGAGMGISTWWYRGSEMDIERMLEQQSGRRITELELDGNKGFKAWDTNACSVYVAKDGDVITWSIQTLNPSSLPDLCIVTQQLAQLSQDRVN